MKYKKRLSLIWLLKNIQEKNDVTRLALETQETAKEEIQLILCPMDSEVLKETWIAELQKKYETVIMDASDSRAVLLNQAAKAVCGTFVTEIETGDTFEKDYLSVMLSAMEKACQTEGYHLGISRKKCQNDEHDDIFSRRPEKGDILYIDFCSKYACLPYFAAGTWIHADYFTTHSFREDLKYEYEKDYFLRAVLAQEKMVYVKSQLYSYEEARESDIVYFYGCYEKEWYYEALDRFWVPFLEEIAASFGEIPRIIQYQAAFALDIRVEANLNNRNKHCIPEEESEAYLWSWQRILKHIDDQVIMNVNKQHYYTKNVYIQRLFLKLKYGDAQYDLERYYLNNSVYYGSAQVLAASQRSQTVNIQFMEYKEGKLFIDATLSGLYDLKNGRFYIKKDEQEFEVEYNERYSHTKLFGFSIYKRYAFEAKITIEDLEFQQLEFRYAIGHDDNKVLITFDSHTSRLSKQFKKSYWTFGKHFMAAYKGGDIVIYKIRKRSVVKREVLLWLEMLLSGKKRAWLFMAMRMAYFFMKPFWKRRPAWMYIDKIYKAGDSSEYLYRYACAQNDGIDHYYLVDKKCPDCKRLKRDGFKPLIRGSIKHRLMFLYADMMVISNSTVFAFNNYSLLSSSHMRDLFNFHVACVQHGMSVQKIAIAQNRLRDNIRLYFCASKYEIENLSKPVYDYAGRDVLKLTGVPRYDGLINEDKRQLLITPTWRMQAAVPVSKNEGVERSYNPLFKETSYFKVYNSLINDERLLNAAKQYNYRIAYVLHPIVSPQAGDFDTNDYVDIIPSTGDMSYEKVFRESSLMVSDYSGVQFDFAYMRKPLVYLHHDEIPQHYEEGTFHYDTMAFGEICHNNDELIDTLIEYMKNDCKMKPEYKRRADDFFYFSDHNNCKRIYDIMIDYQKKHFD
ncbi:MAG: CDP-glycerol glycerophosphotransferase family protein [Lachnospiraceae bacterium]|nr:CDP-glycerol glycerophosphotransferase family protein [Lachnospiraceae bacterium]